MKKAKNQLANINATLEQKVAIEVEKNIKKEKLMLQQSRLAQMGELLSMIAHQWKQPLNSLALLNQSMILKYSKDKLDQKFISYFKVNSKKQIEHMSNTIDDFSNFFKPEKEKVNFNVVDTINHILDMVKPIYEKHNINIVSELSHLIQHKNQPKSSLLVE